MDVIGQHSNGVELPHALLSLFEAHAAELRFKIGGHPGAVEIDFPELPGYLLAD